MPGFVDEAEGRAWNLQDAAPSGLGAPQGGKSGQAKGRGLDHAILAFRGLGIIRRDESDGLGQVAAGSAGQDKPHPAFRASAAATIASSSEKTSAWSTTRPAATSSSAGAM